MTHAHHRRLANLRGGALKIRLIYDVRPTTAKTVVAKLPMTALGLPTTVLTVVDAPVSHSDNDNK
jgi:hypothetical protein